MGLDRGHDLQYPFVILSSFKSLDENVQSCYFTCCFLLVLNLIPHPKGRNRLKVLENKMPKKIFRPYREEVVGGWRRLCNEELHSF